MKLSLFSAKAEYACVAMMELAARFGDSQPVRLKTIADEHRIPRRFLVQILLQLNGAGLVESRRGAAGGYLLARSPDAITVADIIRVIDSARGQAKVQKRPRKKVVRPINTGLNESGMYRALQGVWTEILDAQKRILEETTLSKLVEDSRSGLDLMYEI